MQILRLAWAKETPCSCAALVYRFTMHLPPPKAKQRFTNNLARASVSCIRATATVSHGRSAFVVREGVRVASGDTIAQINVTIAN